MDHSLAEELYSDSLRLSKMELSSLVNDKNLVHDGNVSDTCDEGGSVWDDTDDILDKSSDLDREWQKRHDQFYTIGYRDGLIAGKEASAQEGFNVGFKQSVADGYNWGLVRGVTSALACLPDELKERLVEAQEQRHKFQKLHASVQSLSTSDALKLFADQVMAEKTTQQSDRTDISTPIPGSKEQSSKFIPLESYFAKLKSLLVVSPSIEVQLDAVP